jgi:predicted enzyme related to lactoylglutathione lyase
MGRILKSVAILVTMAGAVSAEPYQEITVGLPVANLAEAEIWYAKFLGSNVKVVRPVPGVTEFKIAPGVWLQLFESEGQAASEPVVRFKVDDIAAVQRALTSAKINSGEAIDVPGVVTYSEFNDPFGNNLGLYDLP